MSKPEECSDEKATMQFLMDSLRETARICGQLDKSNGYITMEERRDILEGDLETREYIQEILSEEPTAVEVFLCKELEAECKTMRGKLSRIHTEEELTRERVEAQRIRTLAKIVSLIQEQMEEATSGRAHHKLEMELESLFREGREELCSVTHKVFARAILERENSYHEGYLVDTLLHERAWDDMDAVSVVAHALGMYDVGEMAAAFVTAFDEEEELFPGAREMCIE